MKYWYKIRDILNSLPDNKTRVFRFMMYHFRYLSTTKNPRAESSKDVWFNASKTGDIQALETLCKGILLSQILLSTITYSIIQAVISRVACRGKTYTTCYVTSYFLALICLKNVSIDKFYVIITTQITHFAWNNLNNLFKSYF